MPAKEVITADKGLKSPLLSQAIKYGDTIYVSGNVGIDCVSMKMVEGSVSDRTVRIKLSQCQGFMLMNCCTETGNTQHRDGLEGGWCISE